MSYDYYDADNRWQTETTLRTDASNQPVAPQRLRLQFTHDKLTREVGHQPRHSQPGSAGLLRISSNPAMLSKKEPPSC